MKEKPSICQSIKEKTDFQMKFEALPLEIQNYLNDNGIAYYFGSSIAQTENGWEIDPESLPPMIKTAYYAVVDKSIDKLVNGSNRRASSYASYEMASEIKQNALDAEFTLDYTKYVQPLIDFLKDYSQNNSA